MDLGGEVLAEKIQMHHFHELYQDYSDDVYRYIYFMIGDYCIAEDLVQETFIRAFRSLSAFRREANIRTWLLSIARNSTIDYLRKKRISSWLPLLEQRDIASDQPLPEEILLKDEKIQELYLALTLLKRDQREVIILRKLQELSTIETAEILGWSEAKVKSTLLRGLQALKEKLVGGDVDELARSIQ